MFPSDEAACWYLAGVFDGEGNIGKRAIKGTARGFARDARITNTDEGLLSAAETALTRIGITFRRYDRSERERLGKLPIFDIVITGKENLDRLLELVPMQTVKRQKLEEATSSYVRKNRPPQAELEAHLTAGLTDKKIGELYGVTAGAVWFWRKHYGLERG